MEVSIIISIILLAFVVYRDLSHRKDMSKKDEIIKDLTLKFMSRNVLDYKRATEAEPKDTIEKKDPMIPIEDVPFDKIQEARDKL